LLEADLSHAGIFGCGAFKLRGELGDYWFWILIAAYSLVMPVNIMLFQFFGTIFYAAGYN